MKKQFSYDKILLFGYFIFLSLIGMVLLHLPIATYSDTPLTLIDSLFTAVSACCVTGLSPVPMHLISPFGFTVIAVLIELGGLGLIAFFSSYIYFSKSRVSLINRRLIKSFCIDEVETEPRKILILIITITFLCQFLGAIALYISFSQDPSVASPVGAAVFHSISAFCNAGFSFFDDSLCRYSQDTFFVLSLCFLITTGGIGFIVYKDIFFAIRNKSRRHHRLCFHSRVVLIVSFVLTVAGILLLLLLEFDNAFCDLPFGKKLLTSIFYAITPRTAGIDILPQQCFSAATTLFTCIYMFIGGSPGSMAGGVKTTTFFIVFAYTLLAREDRSGMMIGNRTVCGTTIAKAFNIIFKCIILQGICFFLLLVSESQSLQNGIFSIFDLVFEEVSAFATVGLSKGITGQLSTLGKFWIILAMFIGRTGVFAMLLHLPDVASSSGID